MNTTWAHVISPSLKWEAKVLCVKWHGLILMARCVSETQRTTRDPQTATAWGERYDGKGAGQWAEEGNTAAGAEVYYVSSAAPKVLPAKTPDIGRIHSNTHHSVPSLSSTGPNIQCKCRLGVFAPLCQTKLNAMCSDPIRYLVISQTFSPFSVLYVIQTSVSFTGLPFEHWI